MLASLHSCGAEVNVSDGLACGRACGRQAYQGRYLRGMDGLVVSGRRLSTTALSVIELVCVEEWGRSTRTGDPTSSAKVVQTLERHGGRAAMLSSLAAVPNAY